MIYEGKLMNFCSLRLFDELGCHKGSHYNVLKNRFTFLSLNLRGNFDEGRKIHQSNIVTLVLLRISDTRPAGQSSVVITRSLGLGLRSEIN